MTTTTTTNNNNNNSTTSQACAACRHQRKKCKPHCLLSPYFPYNDQTQFLNAHKLFGVNNIIKIIQNLNQFERDEAMKSIIFQSNARAKDRVGGCYRIIQNLNREVNRHQAELNLVLKQLAHYRAKQAHILQEETYDINNYQWVMHSPDLSSLNNGNGSFSSSYQEQEFGGMFEERQLSMGYDSNIGAVQYSNQVGYKQENEIAIQNEIREQTVLKEHETNFMQYAGSPRA